MNEFLNQIEKFKGTLIVVTNYTDILDEALGRRFVFHLAFNYPDPKSRLKLWKSWKSELNIDKVTLQHLATEYDLIGGEIRNVVSQIKIRNLKNINKIKDIIEGEVRSRTGFSNRKIGF